MPLWFTQSPAAAWLLGLALAAAIVAAFFLLRRQQRGSQARAHAEALAQSADADHEGARTRHEGGA